MTTYSYSSVDSIRSPNSTQSRPRPSIQDGWSPPRKREGETLLAFKLRQKGIPTLKRKSVRSYQGAVFWNQEGNWFVKTVLGLPDEFLGMLIVAFVFLGTAAFLALGGPLIVVFTLLATAGVSLMVCACNLWLSIVYGDQILVWKRTPYHLYERDVPDEIRELREKVKTLFPEFDAWILHLGIDPFLIVREHGEEECIAAWNTPGLADF